MIRTLLLTLIFALSPEAGHGQRRLRGGCVSLRRVRTGPRRREPPRSAWRSRRAAARVGAGTRNALQPACERRPIDAWILRIWMGGDP